MTEALMEFVTEYMPQIIGIGFGFGSIMAVISILLGYAISKALGFVDNT